MSCIGCASTGNITFYKIDMQIKIVYLLYNDFEISSGSQDTLFVMRDLDERHHGGVLI